ncbi:hypothetical protein [Sporosarcina ureilytica]|uniref:hypothetical protein n=1 Tax=Sporosarcina ureilytica TaxID=298596 RepID=UPI0012DB6CC8|nr:hypothetical protein [Sporosarcina ureilytica]
MLNLVRNLMGKLQLPENLLTIKIQLENDKRDAMLEEQDLSRTDQQLLIGSRIGV